MMHAGSVARPWLLGAAILLADARPAPIPAIIPRPATLEARSGGFLLRPGARVYVSPDTPEVRGIAEILSAPISAAAERPRDAIWLRVAPGLAAGPESYELTVDSKGVELRAAAVPGLFYGVQTLRQMLPADADRARAFRIPAVRIVDSPRFRWRGLMLDCSRTFLPLGYLKRTVDRMALYKLNVLQLHLTDDEGWRLEIRRYPELTQRGSRFAPAYGGAGGFYTQAEMRELVRYAGARNVSVVPEIEMPGHSQAWLVASPELRCDVPLEQPLEMSPFFAKPRVGRDLALCAGNEKVFEVSENVLAEVLELFPSPFLHIGGDEVSKYWWDRCPRCQARRKREGLRNADELQSYFIRRIGTFLASRGRRMLGWDEIVEGGLAPGATVMGWRGFERAAAAAAAGHDVVLSPTRHCYFDYSEKSLPAERVYAFDPAAAGFGGATAARVLGVQANMWTHIATTERAIDHHIYPRLLALAEVGWSPQAAREWGEFSTRLASHMDRLRSMGIPHHDSRWPGREIGGWQPGELAPGASKVFEWDATADLDAAGGYEIQVWREAGTRRVYVEWVALAENGAEISRESFPGAMYGPYQMIVGWVRLAERKPHARYTVRVGVRGAPGDDAGASVRILRAPGSRDFLQK